MGSTSGYRDLLRAASPTVGAWAQRKPRNWARLSGSSRNGWWFRSVRGSPPPQLPPRRDAFLFSAAAVVRAHIRTLSIPRHCRLESRTPCFDAPAGKLPTGAVSGQPSPVSYMGGWRGESLGPKIVRALTAAGIEPSLTPACRCPMDRFCLPIRRGPRTPFFLGGQPLAGPGAERAGLLEIDAIDRVRQAFCGGASNCRRRGNCHFIEVGVRFTARSGTHALVVGPDRHFGLVEAKALHRCGMDGLLIFVSRRGCHCPLQTCRPGSRPCAQNPRRCCARLGRLADCKGCGQCQAEDSARIIAR